MPAYKVKGRFAVFTEEQERELDRKANEDKCFEIKYFVESSVVSPVRHASLISYNISRNLMLTTIELN